MEESEAAQEIEALRAIWPELQDRPPVWNCPAIAIPVCPLGSLDAKSPTRITVVVIFNPRYPKVPPRLELESPSQLDEDEVARLKHMLDVKAAEVAGTGMVMVHDLLVLTNDFLSDKNRADEERSRGGDESLFQKMITKEQRQRDKREEEERAEEKRQRDEEAKELLEEEARGEAQWAVVREKLEQERERRRAASAGFLGVMEGVIPEVSAGGEHEHDTGEAEAQDQGAGAAREREGREEDEEDSNASNDSWMNHPQDNHNGADRRFPAGGGGGEGGSGAVKERSSWYRSQFKELENLGKGGFGTVVKVRNRVDRRLYAVKKVGLDPFDKETNRKIRREVTTISTLIHKNIVRYYQAWLEGGGGAFPAAVEEERSGDEDNDDDDEDDATGAKGASALAKNTAAKGKATAAAVAATGHDVPGATDIGQSEEDQSEMEAELGFFRTTKSLSRGKKNRNSEPKPTACGADSEHVPRDTGTMSTGLEGNEAGGSHVHFDDSVGGRGCQTRHSMELGEGDTGSTIAVGGEDSSAAPGTTAVLGKKAKRLLKKQARKKKRLLDFAAATAAAVGSDDAGAAGKGFEGTTGKGESDPLRIPRGRRKRAAAAAAAAAAATAAATKKEEPTQAVLAPPAVPATAEAPWAQKRGRTNHLGSFGSMASLSSSSGDSGTVDTDNEAVADGRESVRTSDDDDDDDADNDWSDQEGSNDQGITGSEEGSWGSGGGDYRSHGQGKLVSDAEFFQYFGSPERARQASDAGAPPVPASWSSEDALMQLYEETRRNRDRKNKPSSASAASSSAKTPNRSLPSSLPGSPRPGGTGGLDSLITPPPPVTRGGERQFLYIQMEYCENTLRHLIDHGELWREEQRCWRLFRQMLEGVDFIHSKGIIHRDLTPPNVFLDAEENVKLGDFGLATSKKPRTKGGGLNKLDRGAPYDDDDDDSTNADGGWTTINDNYDGAGSMSSAFPSVFGELELPLSDTSQLTDGVGTGPYIAPEQGARFGQYNHKADMWSLGVILFEMLAPRFSTLMERAGVMTALRSPGEAEFPPAFEERVPDNAKQVIRWLLMADAGARPTAAELLSSALLPPKLEVEASFLREALRVMGNPESDTFQVVVKALLDQETAEHVEHWYDHEPLKTVSARIPIEAPAVALVCDGLRRVFETHGATPVAPPIIRPMPPPSLAPPASASRGLVRLVDHKGAVVTLPGNLTAPFARFVARSGVTRLKRYQIDRIFLAGGAGESDDHSSDRSCVEAWEADFDIISSAHSSSAAAASYGGAGRGVDGNSGITARLPTSLDGDGRGVRAALRHHDSGEGRFEVAEAEAVLVISQVMGTFEGFLGPWFLRFGHVKMSQAILELCGVPQDVRPIVIGLLGKLARGSITPAKAFSEVGSKGLSEETLLNVRPFLHHMGKNPFEALSRLEVLVQRIPAVKSVMELPGRRRELTRKEAVRTKRSLRVYREAREGLSALVIGLARLGIISLPFSWGKEDDAVDKGGKSGGGGGGGGGSQASSVRSEDGKRSGRRRQQQARGEHAASRDRNRTDSTDSRAGGERSDGDPRGGSIGRRSHTRGGGGGSGGGGESLGSTAAGFGVGGAGRTGGELDGECWKGGVVVMPSFVMLDLGLTQRQGSYASGTVFQAALANGVSLSSRGGDGYRSSLTVAEGGRYDDLVAKHRYHLRATSKVSGASALCAVGVRFAVEKLASMLVTARNVPLPGLKNQPQISRRPVDAIVCAGGGFESQGLQERVLVAARLWAGGIRAEYLATDALVRAGAGKGGGLEGAAEACLSLGIPFVVVVRPHTLAAKKAVKVMSVMEKGGGQLEVPLDHLAQHVTDGLAALADPASAQGGTSGGPGGHQYHHSTWSANTGSSASAVSSGSSGGGVTVRLALVDRGQHFSGPLLDREKMNRQEYKNYSTLERKAASLLDAAIAGPIEGKREGNGPLVLATEASFAAVRGLTTCYMLYGRESKALREFLADHPEKKVLRNLLTSLQQVEEGGRRKSGGGKGQQQGKGGRDQQAQSSSHARQVFVYSQPDEVMDIMTFSNPSASGGLLGHHQASTSSSARAGRGLR